MGRLTKGSEETKEIAEKGTKASKVGAEVKRLIKELEKGGNIDTLQMKTMKNFAEMLDDPDKQVRAFATKEVSKYLFSTKKEVTKFPAININVTFEGIKDDNKTVSN